MPQNLSLSFFEILSLIGFIQCVFLTVYIGARMARLGRIRVSFFYLLSLGLAFFLDLAENQLGTLSPYYDDLQWFAWFLGPPLSVLVIIQVSDLNKKLAFRDYWIILLVPLCYLLSINAAYQIGACNPSEQCDELTTLMNVTGLLAGSISLLIIFSYKDLFNKLKKQKLGKERYWLILSLITLNGLVLCALMASAMDMITLTEAYLMRTIMGLAFVYLVSTSFLRLYPKSEPGKSAAVPEDFTDAERDLAQK